MRTEFDTMLQFNASFLMYGQLILQGTAAMNLPGQHQAAADSNTQVSLLCVLRFPHPRSVWAHTLDTFSPHL